MNVKFQNRIKINVSFADSEGFNYSLFNSRRCFIESK